MSEDEIDALRRYAANQLAWKQLSDAGWSYGEVLAGLDALGLRPPIAGNDGPNAEALARGRALVRRALADGPQ